MLQANVDTKASLHASAMSGKTVTHAFMGTHMVSMTPMDGFTRNVSAKRCLHK